MDHILFVPFGEKRKNQREGVIGGARVSGRSVCVAVTDTVGLCALPPLPSCLVLLGF